MGNSVGFHIPGKLIMERAMGESFDTGTVGNCPPSYRTYGPKYTDRYWSDIVGLINGDFSDEIHIE